MQFEVRDFMSSDPHIVHDPQVADTLHQLLRP